MAARKEAYYVQEHENRGTAYVAHWFYRRAPDRDRRDGPAGHEPIQHPSRGHLQGEHGARDRTRRGERQARGQREAYAACFIPRSPAGRKRSPRAGPSYYAAYRQDRKKQGRRQ